MGYPFLANYCVYFVEHAHEEENAEALYGGEIVQYDHEADVSLMIVDQPHMAAIHIMRENFPR